MPAKWKPNVDLSMYLIPESITQYLYLSLLLEGEYYILESIIGLEYSLISLEYYSIRRLESIIGSKYYDWSLLLEIGGEFYLILMLESIV